MGRVCTGKDFETGLWKKGSVFHAWCKYCVKAKIIDSWTEGRTLWLPAEIRSVCRIAPGQPLHRCTVNSISWVLRQWALRHQWICNMTPWEPWSWRSLSYDCKCDAAVQNKSPVKCNIRTALPSLHFYPPSYSAVLQWGSDLGFT